MTRHWTLSPFCLKSYYSWLLASNKCCHFKLEWTKYLIAKTFLTVVNNKNVVESGIFLLKSVLTIGNNYHW
jgi:hypothetical protein